MVSYGLVTFGSAMLWATLICSVLAVVFLAVGGFGKSEDSRRWGYRLTYLVALAAFLSCLSIVIGFFTHDIGSQYVAQNYPVDTHDGLFWLYRLSGLWAGRAGSLLLWAFLITAFAAFVAFARRKQHERLTTIALLVIQVVIALFAMTMLFSSSNDPFIKTSESYISDGQLTGVALQWGMNVLLQHWAMVLHPPMLFIGYAGMTVPFAYGIAALVVNDPSKRWVDLCQRMALFAFIFLSVGIGLGAVWAYVVLGWGGYWGWDPVENASLLSWLTAVAMLHSFNAYRRRGMMRGWALLSATLTFVFVVMGTFITRSGLVQSVHAFSSDPVSTALFLTIMIVAFLAFAILWVVRRKSFASVDDIESVVSKNGSFYLTCLITIFAGILLAYLTVASALPSWLPAGGSSIGTGAYETIARPLGILVCALAAVCPFLSWKRTDGKEFRRNLLVPAIAALVIFALLMVVFFTRLLPAYEQAVADGGTTASDLADMGPSWYYNGLAVVGLLVASLLVACSVYLVVRGVRGRMTGKGEGAGRALANLFLKSPAAFGGYLTHLGLGVVLVGLIGSAMYVTEETYNITYANPGSVTVGAYTIEYKGLEQTEVEATGGVDIAARVGFAREGVAEGELAPSIEIVSPTTGSIKMHAKTHSTPLEDLFLAVTAQQNQQTGQIQSIYLDVRINPLIWFVWVGFGIMVVGIVCATIPRRGISLTEGAELAAADEQARQAAALEDRRGRGTAGQRKSNRPKKSR